MNVRAKFRCDSVTTHAAGGKTVVFFPVQNGSEENKSFSKYTPSGKLELSISEGTAAAGAFEAGKEYYLDFTPVEG